jgi:hypothetical protein
VIRRPRKPRTRDGLFQRGGWWWVDFYDADGRRHRKKAAPDYNTAKIIYRNTMTAIAKGEVLGVREEGIRFRTSPSACGGRGPSRDWRRHGQTA